MWTVDYSVLTCFHLIVSSVFCNRTCLRQNTTKASISLEEIVIRQMDILRAMSSSFNIGSRFDQYSLLMFRKRGHRVSAGVTTRYSHLDWQSTSMPWLFSLSFFPPTLLVYSSCSLILRPSFRRLRWLRRSWESQPCWTQRTWCPWKCPTDWASSPTSPSTTTSSPTSPTVGANSPRVSVWL